MKSKRSKYILLTTILFFLLIPTIYATTVRETTTNNDGYDTITSNTFVIGITKFTENEIITGGKAATAGANDAVYYATKNGTTAGYKSPTVYYYIEGVAWFAVDSNTNEYKAVTDTATLNKLSNLDIYYVNNVEKVLAVDYDGDEIDTTLLASGIEYKDSKLLVNATVSKFEVQTTTGKKHKYIMDETTSIFIEDILSCYTVLNNVITDYDETCGSNIVIPTTIDNQAITGIGENAFSGKNLESIIIPNTIMTIGANAFTNNANLTTITIKDKYDSGDFTEYNETAFSENTTVVYDNDLTRALKNIPDEYTIKVYSNLDLDNLTTKYHFESLIASKLSRELNNYDSTTSIVYTGELSQQQNRMNLSGKIFTYVNECENNVCEVILSKVIMTPTYQTSKDVSKNITINLEKTGNILDKAYVDNAVNNIQEDDSELSQAIKKDWSQTMLTTRRKYLDDLEDNYDLEYIYNIHSGSGDGILEGEVDGSFFGGKLYIFKNDILYAISEEIKVVGFENVYRPTISIADYEDIDLYLEDVLKKFEERTGVTNYTISLDEEGNKYTTYTSGTRMYFQVYLTDNDYLEYWTIFTSKVVDDIYDENETTLETCFTFSDGTITNYDGSCGANVRIPSTINGESVTRIASSSFWSLDLQSVAIPDIVTEISSYAFAYNELKTIELPANLIEIGYGAFCNNQLESIVIPDSLETINSGAFQNNKIEKVTLGNNLTTIEGYVFSNNEIVSIEFSDSLKKIGDDAFAHNKIETLEIPDSVEMIESFAFLNNNIKSLTLPNSLQYLSGGAFNNNQLSDEEAFIYNRIYNWETDSYEIDTTTVISYGGANKDNIQIPSNITTIGAYAFANLGLESIVIPYGITNIGYEAFSNNKLTEISVPASVVGLGTGIFNYNEFEGDNRYIYSRDGDGNIDYTTLVAFSDTQYEQDILEIPTQVKVIKSYAFSNVKVKELIIPYGVEEIGTNAFYSLYLESIPSIPKSVTEIGSAIFNNYSYNENLSVNDRIVYARNEDGTIDKTIIMAFVGTLTDNLVIPEGVTEIRENAFSSKASSWETIKYSITLPSTLKKIGDYAFAENDFGTSTINLPEGLEEIGESAFCYNTFTEIEIPSTVKTISERSFQDNYGLEKITLNEGLEKIEELAFSWSSIESIDIPSTVKYIGSNALTSSNDLSNIKIYGKSSLEDFEYLDVNAFSIIEGYTTLEFINE